MSQNENDKKLLAAAINRLHRMKMAECFDSINTDSRPTDKQLQVLRDINTISHRYVTAGNQSGKSQLGAREVAWIFEDTHPYWKRPKEWGEEPLILLVIGRVSKQVEEVLWRKIKGFLDPGNYKAIVQGQALQKVVNTKNGNTILFLSHHSDNEAREKVQAYVAHYAWVDEMPKSVKLLEEVHRRIQARNGYFLATFTPKVVNEDIKKLVDSSKEPISKKYKLSMLDNPIYEGREQELLDQLATYSESYRNTILYGDWSNDEDSVYEFNADTMVKELPPNYSPAWRHVEAVDPALKSKMGYTLWAEDPMTGFWYCVKAEYISGIYVPEQLVDKACEFSRGYNLHRRICDTHESWYLGTASQKGIIYMTPWNKKERKGEFIKNLQAAMGTRIFLTPWVTDLIDEFVSCRWSETNSDKIVNASSYHLLDTAQYFVDLMPKYDKAIVPQTWHERLYQENEKRKMKESMKVRTKGRIRRRTW